MTSDDIGTLILAYALTAAAGFLLAGIYALMARNEYGPGSDTARSYARIALASLVWPLALVVGVVAFVAFVIRQAMPARDERPE